MQWGLSKRVDSSSIIDTQVPLTSMNTFVSGSCTVYGERENTGSIVSYSDGILKLRNTFSGERRGSGQLYYIVIGY